MMIPSPTQGVTAKRWANPNHWANAGLVVWWISLPGQIGGTKWIEPLNVQPMPLTYATNIGGSEMPYAGFWRPSENAGNTASAAVQNLGPRPGALCTSSIGPFWFSDNSNTTIYSATGAINASIAGLCPTNGTTAFWLRSMLAYNAGDNQVVLGQNLASVPQFYVGKAGGSFYGGYYTGTEYRAVLSLTSGNWSNTAWHHYTVTWGVSTKSKVYVDGVLAATATNTAPASTPSIGATLCTVSTTFSGNYFLNSVIDDLAIWNYQMSASQVYGLYAQSYMGWPGRLRGTSIHRPKPWTPSRIIDFTYDQCMINE